MKRCPHRETHTHWHVLLASATQPMPEHKLTAMWPGLRALETIEQPHTNDWRVCSDAVNLLETPMTQGTVQDSNGLVMVKSQPYAIVEIGLRMHKPRKLYRAQGFKDSYIIDWGIHPHTGQKIKLTATASIRMCGNSVCPPMARAYVAANYRERTVMLEAA